MKCLMRAWEQHEQELHAWLHKQLHNNADVEDLMQELFLKALRHNSRFCGELNSTRAWLFSVARNTLTDRARTHKHFVEVPDTLASTTPDIAPIVSLSACLPEVLQHLAETDREIIQACDIDGMPQEQFAQQQGLSLVAAKSRIQRARKRLRKQLEITCQVRFDPQGQVCCFKRCPAPQ